MDAGPEFRLFCFALRRPQSPDDTREMRHLAAGVADWDIIVRAAQRHRVAPFVMSGLLACGSPQLPETVAAALRRLSFSAARQSLLQVMELGRLRRLFADAGIRLLVLKGVVLSAQLYGDPGLRAPRDIDLLVDPDDFRQAGEVLAGSGYRQILNLRSPGQNAAYLRWVKEVAYIHVETGVVVELHHRVTDNPSLLPLDFAALWAEREEVRLGGFAIATLPRHRLPLYLCVHGAVHAWTRLDWLVDFAAALPRVERMSDLIAAADAHGVKRAFLHALLLARDWLGVSIDHPDLAAHGQHARVERLKWLLGRLYRPTDWYDPAPPGSWKKFVRISWWSRLYRLSIKSDWHYRASEAKRELFSCADWDIVSLPETLTWLYLLVRPWGWLVRRLRPAAR